MELANLILELIWYIYAFVIAIIIATKYTQQNEGTWALVGILCLITTFGSTLNILNVLQNDNLTGFTNIYFKVSMIAGTLFFGSLGIRFISNWLLKNKHT